MHIVKVNRLTIADRTVFLAGIALSSLALSPAILDFTLNPRLVTLSVFLLATTILIARKTTLSYNHLDLCFVGFCIYYAFGQFWALNRHEALGESSRQLLWAGFYILAVRFWRENGELLNLQLSRMVMLIITVLFLVFCWQLSQSGGLEKEKMYSITGLNGHKNLFSSILFLLAGFLLITDQHDASKWKFLKYSSIVFAVLILLCLRTKAVWFAGFFGLIIFLLINRTGQKVLSKRFTGILTGIFCAVILLLFLGILPVLIDHTLGGLRQGRVMTSIFGDEERLLLWQKTYYLIRENWLAGLGPGNWQIHLPDAGLTGLYRAEDLNFTFQRPHNDFLWILSESGIIGFFIFAFLISRLLALLLNAALTGTGTEKRKFTLLVCVLIGFMIISFFDFPRERTEHMIWFILLVSLASATLQTRIRAFELRRSGVLTTALMAVFTFALISTVMRYKGELHTRRLYTEKHRANNFAILHEAEKAASMFYSLDPTSVPLYWYSGNALAEEKQFSNALAHFEKAYKLNPFNRNVLNDLASACVNVNDTARAIRLYTEASRISPRFDEAKLNLATIYFTQGKLKEARQVLSALMHDSERRTRLEQLVKLRLSQQ